MLGWLSKCLKMCNRKLEAYMSKGSGVWPAAGENSSLLDMPATEEPRLVDVGSLDWSRSENLDPAGSLLTYVPVPIDLKVAEPNQSSPSTAVLRVYANHKHCWLPGRDYCQSGCGMSWLHYLATLDPNAQRRDLDSREFSAQQEIFDLPDIQL